MLRLVLLSLAAILLSASGVLAHGTHSDCRVGNSWMGVVPHYHSGGTGGAANCNEGRFGGDPGYAGNTQHPAYNPGNNPGYNPGYNQGYNPGYQGGYDPGYDDGYDDAPPPPPRGYYRRGYGGAPRPGDDGPQTNRAQDCYNVYGNRICCPKGWTVQNGQCQPYRGR